MAEPRYQFMPWARRGLAAEVEDPDTRKPTMSAHARFGVALTVSNVTPEEISLQLFGPGDVMGVDPRLIARAVPRPGSTDAEPNYCAALEFDPPDFPWLFMPARQDAENRLRPWCVLVVVDTEVVAAPSLPKGAPLPQITIPKDAAFSELPELDESWAWAHAQLLTESTSADQLNDELSTRPNLNVSRLICPRRLVAGRRYAACLVPAFEVGRLRGLGSAPSDDATLTPAWKSNPVSDVVLPVYFHWEFATGPGGDFESLARALKPHRCDPATVGTQKMYLAQAEPAATDLVLSDDEAVTGMDGVLRAPSGAPATLEEIAQTFQTWLRDLLEQPERRLLGNGSEKTKALGQPIYGAEHLGRHTVPEAAPDWFKNLNLDPRTRVAAGLGMQVVKANQEDFVRVCWEQVGQILAANELLSRGRLALEGLRRIHTRHLQPMDDDRLLLLASPLLDRVASQGRTARTLITSSSMPDATVGAAMRRLTSAQNPVFKRLARRSSQSRPVRTEMVKLLSAGWDGVDPAAIVPDGIANAAAIEHAIAAPTSGTRVGLAAFGLALEVSGEELAELRQRYRAVGAGRTGGGGPLDIRGRDDLDRMGVRIANPVDSRSGSTLVLPDWTRLGSPVTERGASSTRERLPEADRILVGRFEIARNNALRVLHLDAPTPVARKVPFALSEIAADLKKETSPTETVPRRLRAMISVNSGEDLRVAGGLKVPSTFDRIMVAPTIASPLYPLLAAVDRDRFLPGADGIPGDAITLLETNPRFIEAFMVGANFELNAELLWRRFPTDGRGTSLRHFWSRTDARPDIDSIHEWPSTSTLGSHTPGTTGGQLVLVVRGRLLMRYPNAVLYAWRATSNKRLKPNPVVGLDLLAPVFGGRLEPDLTFAGFEITDHAAVEGDGWFFVIQEQPTEPRFGFDEPKPNQEPAIPSSWSNATWADVGVGPGGYVRLRDNPLTSHVADEVHFGQDAAHQASLMLQQPARVAIHASQLMA